MSEQVSVLYDVPGPRARRRTLLISVLLGILALVGLYYFVYLPLQARGQLSAEKWGPLLDSGNESTPLVWDRIWTGFQATLTAASIAIVLAFVFGTMLGILRLQLRALRTRRYAGLPRPVALSLRGGVVALDVVIRVAVEFFRGIPVLVTMFFAWSLAGGGTSPWPVIIALTIYNGIVIAEIIRSGMQNLPSGQREAASAIGLSPLQSTWLIQLPQAFRIMLPALISQMIVVLKDTTLGYIVLYEEILQIAQQIILVLNNPIQVYVILGAIFILINYALSKLATYVERRLSRRAGRTVRVVAPAGTGADSGTI
jgi:glutamate transport system permease protein